MMTPEASKSLSPALRSIPRAEATTISLAVFAISIWRMWPPVLVYEEPLWLREASPWNLFAPWNGFVQVFARVAFALSQPLGDLAPLATRLIAAGVIAAVAFYLLSASEAIPSRLVRMATALALPILPTGYPGPYIGPLNSAWWFTIAVVLIALSPPRRWHWPALLVAGLSGAGPCVALPVFRDRRGVALLVPTVIQLVVLVVTGRPSHPPGPGISMGFLVMTLLVLGSLAFAPLPVRTRNAFAYTGLALIALGSIASGGADLQDRYLAVAWTAVVLGAVATVEIDTGAQSGWASPLFENDTNPQT